MGLRLVEHESGACGFVQRVARIGRKTLRSARILEVPIGKTRESRARERRLANLTRADDDDHRKAAGRSLYGRQDDSIEHALYFGLYDSNLQFWLKPRTYRRRETYAVAQGTSFSAVVLTGTFSLPREHAHPSDAGFRGGLGAGERAAGPLGWE